MSSARELRALTVPRVPDELPGAVPELRAALDGTGPALLPLAPDDPTAGETARSLGAGEPLAEGEDSGDDPTALVIATSGSTGAPKGVLLSASALRSSARATHEHLGGAGQWLLAMPAHHVAGIQVLVRSVVAGLEPGVVDAREGFTAGAFAEAAEPLLGTGHRHYTALVPTQLSRLLDPANDPRGLRALRGFDAVLVGGAATAPALLERARAAGVNVVTTYGMSETAGGCVYDGTPLAGVGVHVESPEPGRISLSGPTLARGYRHSPGSAAFEGGWFRTGDVGQWRGHRLEVLGRADDMIVTGAVKVVPTSVERALVEHPDVREACVLGGPDPEWGQAVLAAVVPERTAPDERELHGLVRQRLGAAAAPKRFLVVDELPLRGPGKPDKRALLAMFG
ncbi:AMP-dependent synthetase [Actinopolyspora erythraea]|uniref:AMP-dependent synthetase n=1 Tax=Actinopolyspora erythraea TaxID=414996 RepID=A0A099DA50_9ACTN|nr:o-succinylbenzoate--CoA ligase [Actinopolyspora erythraea]ASU80266.1 AMP-dependent synthetase [Actinopolyspora erythraea]KGI82652.1 AMP-dependent synthetase [Actinopolyspora erythraea]